MATNAQAKAFIELVAPIMVKLAKAKGYKIVSVAIAQACIESAYGTSSLGYKYHNYFGMKAGKSWKGGIVNLKTKEEYKVGQLTTIVDGFRTYPTLEDGLKGYYDFISAKRYANLKTAKTAQEYATNLKNDGYATSSTYVNTLMTTVKKWELTKYDNVDPASNTIQEPVKPVKDVPIKSSNPKLANVVTVRLNSTGPSVLYMKSLLAVKGYQVGTVNNVADAQTILCLKQFQRDRNLTADGICGINTWTELIK